MRTIAVVNQKGGTGKTTTVVNLGHALAAGGVKTLLIDADPQASLTFYMGSDERDLDAAGRTLYHAMTGRIDVAETIIEGDPALIPSSISLAKADAELMAEPGATQLMRELLAEVAPAFGAVLIDCPPTLTLLTVNALAAADAVLIPVKTDLLSTLGIPQLLDTVAKVRRRANPRLEILGILPTLYNARFGHDAEVLDEIGATFGPSLRVFEPIHRSTGFDRAAGTGQATVTAQPTSQGAVAYKRLAGEVLTIMKGSGRGQG